MGVIMTYTRFRNTNILGNIKNHIKILVFASVLSSTVGCNAIEETRAYQSIRWSHYGSRITDVMHCTRAIQFGSEEASYSSLLTQWHGENVNIRNCKNRAARSQEPKQRLSPGRANSPLGGS